MGSQADPVRNFDRYVSFLELSPTCPPDASRAALVLWMGQSQVQLVVPEELEIGCHAPVEDSFRICIGYSVTGTVYRVRVADQRAIEGASLEWTVAKRHREFRALHDLVPPPACSY